MKTLSNQVQLIGRLGEAVELKKAENGSDFARLSIAINESYKNKNGEKVENTSWFNCIAWGKTAELLEQYGEKGKKMLVHGKLSNHNYTDKEGVKRYATEIYVDEFLFL